MEKLNIKELIHAVRQELIDSETLRKQKNIEPLFEVDNLKIEVNFVVEKTTDTGGGINLKIIDIGKSVKYNSQQVHKITLELKTCSENNTPILPIPSKNYPNYYPIIIDANNPIETHKPMGTCPGIKPPEIGTKFGKAVEKGTTLTEF